MKKASTYLSLVVSIVLVLAFSLSVISSLTATEVASAAAKTTYTRQGDTVWFGYYPQTKATDEEVAKMSSSPDADGYYTSGNDKFVKVTSADPKEHSETADTTYIPFDDNSQPVVGATYYFKMEPIEWKVMVDDADNNAVKLVSKKYLDTHVWLTEFVKGGSWWEYYNTLDGVPENTPANGWRYSEIRAWLNDGFLNTAFTEEEKKSIYVFANKNTIDYREDDETTVVNDYVAIGNRNDYDAAGTDGRPTDYAIVKGASWCYNKDHIYYWVNASFQNFGNDTVRLYRHDEHEKCNTVNIVEAVRPILYVKRGDAKILATSEQKEERSQNVMLIVGIVALVVGAGLALPIMVITSKKQKKSKKETGKDYKLKKGEAAMIAPGMLLLICGVVLIVLQFALFGGGFGGIGGAKLQPGVYVQQGQYSGGGITQVGHTAYRLNSDGTFDYSDSYENNIWSGHGTWKQSGSTVTLVWHGNPMVAEGYTINATVYDGGNSFGSSSERFKRVS